MEKLCFVGRYNPGELFYGPEKVARRIADEMALLGYDVYFYEYFFSGKSYGYMTKLFGYDTIENSAGLSIFRVGIVPFIFVILRRRFDVIHIITFERFALIVLLMKWFVGSKVVFTVHGIVRHENQYFRKGLRQSLIIKDRIIERAFIERSNLVLFLSEESRLLAGKYYNLDSKKTSLIPDGIDSAFNDTFQRRNIIHKKTVDLVFVGDIERPEKGFDFLVKALEQTKGRFRLFVVSRRYAHRPAEAHGMEFIFTDKMPSKGFADWLKDKDIFISASSYEPFSLATVEAMAAGLAIVATAETGMSRYIQNGINGFVIPYGDSAQLAAILSLLYRNSPIRRRVGIEGSKVYSRLTWRQVAQEYIKYYELLK